MSLWIQPNAYEISSFLHPEQIRPFSPTGEADSCSAGTSLCFKVRETPGAGLGFCYLSWGRSDGQSDLQAWLRISFGQARGEGPSLSFYTNISIKKEAFIHSSPQLGTTQMPPAGEWINCACTHNRMKSSEMTERHEGGKGELAPFVDKFIMGGLQALHGWFVVIKSNLSETGAYTTVRILFYFNLFFIRI